MEEKSPKSYSNLIMMIIVIIIGAFSFVLIYVNTDNSLFHGLEPKATYNGYKIYDLVEQRHLACAEAVEILASDNKYTYYFDCLKSDSIYLVKNGKNIKVKDAYNQGIISKEKLYELNIISRMKK
jgi:hypothetical protein